MLNDELLTYLFNGKSHFLAAPMATWLSSSRRFTAFVTTFRAKIRKKLRVTQEIESLLDLRLELEAAYLLLQEPTLSLVYEPLPIGQMRGPDFAVTFTTSRHFIVEVTRLRMVKDSMRDLEQAQAGTLPSQNAPIRSLVEEQLADMVCSKLGQLLPQCINILLVGVETPDLTQDSLRAAMLHLQQRAERNDATVVQRNGFRDRADFFHRYQRLSELLVCGPHLQPGRLVVGWINSQAKYPLPTKVRRILYRNFNN